MTSPELPAGRPVPDTDDLRLLAEIINNGAIGLPQAAWNARMSQAEAAARLVQMAERNLPLRLVAEGDRQTLWRIAQAGPATGGVPVGGPPRQGGFGPQGGPGQPGGPSQQGGPGQQGGPYGPQGQPWPGQSAPGQPGPGQPGPGLPGGPDPASMSTPTPGVQSGQVPIGAQSGQLPVGAVPVQPSGQQPVAPLPGAQTGFPPPGPGQPFAPGVPGQGAQGPVGAPPGGPPTLSAPGPVVLPPTPAVPPHEQAIAGAVPLGQPPFGTPPPEPASPESGYPESVSPESASHGPASPQTGAAMAAGADSVSEPAAAAGDPAAVWGVPGSAAWARGEQGDTPAPAAGQAAEPELITAGPDVSDGTQVSDASWTPGQVGKDAPVESAEEAADPAAGATNPAENWRPEQIAKDAPVDQPVVAEAVVAPGENQIAKDAADELDAAHDEVARPDQVSGWETSSVVAGGLAVGALTDADRHSQPESTFPPEPEPQPEPEPEPQPEPQPEPEPAPQVFAKSPSQVQWQTTIGLAGEQLWVTLLEVIDPADGVLTNAGYRLDAGERAVLVRTAMANHGPAPHDALPDHYLVLRTSTGAILPKAPMGVGSHPAYRVGVAPGGQADGWTVFLIPANTELAEVVWSVRPDLVDRTLSWHV